MPTRWRPQGVTLLIAAGMVVGLIAQVGAVLRRAVHSRPVPPGQPAGRSATALPTVRFEVRTVDEVRIGDVMSGLGRVVAVERTGYQGGYVRVDSATGRSVLAAGSAVLVRADVPGVITSSPGLDGV